MAGPSAHRHHHFLTRRCQPGCPEGAAVCVSVSVGRERGHALEGATKARVTGQEAGFGSVRRVSSPADPPLVP